MTCEDTCNHSTILILGDIRQEKILNRKIEIEKNVDTLLSRSEIIVQILEAFSHNMLLLFTVTTKISFILSTSSFVGLPSIIRHLRK